MTWQEELRKLDEDFSAGKLTADDYRVRREQVLNSAVAPAQQAEPESQGKNAESTQIISASSLPQGAPQHPVQPPPNAAAGQGPAPTPNSEAERTQVVPHWQVQQPTSPPGGTPQQQFPASGGFPQQQYPPSPPGGFPQQQYPPSPPGGFPQVQQPVWESVQQPVWESQNHDPEPPWGGDEFPPVAPSSESDWGIKQGPEGFESGPDDKGKAGKLIAGGLAVVLLIGIAFGAWWLWGRDAATGGDTPGPTAAPTETAPAEPEQFPIAELGGRAEPKESVTSFGDVPEMNYLNPQELATYEDAGAGDARFHVQHLNSGTRAVFLLSEAADGPSAATAAQELSEIQVGNGAEEMDDPPAGIYVTEYTHPEREFGQIRAHYISGDLIVRIEVVSDDGIDAARSALMPILNAQLEVLPADV